MTSANEQYRTSQGQSADRSPTPLTTLLVLMTVAATLSGRSTALAGSEALFCAEHRPVALQVVQERTRRHREARKVRQQHRPIVCLHCVTPQTRPSAPPPTGCTTTLSADAPVAPLGIHRCERQLLNLPPPIC
ncbi:MAG: hypothetical protein KAS72_01850 [Phycisphaerales bacterium]|nr:hypothetical protein [Phycisphaerales bacterium]